MDLSVAEPPVASNGIENVNSKKELERELVKSFAGNYTVSFKFAETFSPDDSYEYRDRHFSEAKEVAFVIEDSEDKISIQHILYIGKERVIKHWRQDWLYENCELLELIKDNEWHRTEISPEQAKGTWTQKVYQVDDAPRYEGFGTWVHIDGRHYWESTTDAAMPRREVNKRDDYNFLKRHSHIEIFEDGSWVIEQDNEKMMRSANKDADTLICLEKGYETFTPEDYDPSVAENFWEPRKAFWADVRQIWAGISSTQNRINLQKDKKLYASQFKLAEQFAGDDYDPAASEAAIKNLLADHVEGYEV